MRTQYFRVDRNKIDPDIIRRAASILKGGGLVAFPTETVYGLGANAWDPDAVSGIFRAKGRPRDNPLIVHIASVSELSSLAREVPAEAVLLAEKYWPGPLTLILRKSRKVPAVVTAGLDSVAVRMPRHPVALALIKEAGIPVAAPSANLSGRPSPTTGRHVLQDLEGRVDVVLDAGRAELGIESTVVDLTGGEPVILRPGGVTFEELSRILRNLKGAPGAAAGEKGTDIAPRSPGMKYRHYSPAAEVLLVEGADKPGNIQLVQDFIRECKSRGRKVALLATSENIALYENLCPGPDMVEVLGSQKDLTGVAAAVYGALRKCDRLGADVVLAEAFPSTGVGAAIMNRLLKAADYRFLVP